jgi:hypothetical protein
MLMVVDLQPAGRAIAASTSRKEGVLAARMQR